MLPGGIQLLIPKPFAVKFAPGLIAIILKSLIFGLMINSKLE